MALEAYVNEDDLRKAYGVEDWATEFTVASARQHFNADIIHIIYDQEPKSEPIPRLVRPGKESQHRTEY